MTFGVKRPDGKRTVENAEVGVNPTHLLLNLMEDIMLPKIDEKQITWRNLMETVVSDRLEEDEEPIVEVGYGPSPMNFMIQQDSPLLEVLRQFPQQHYRREYFGSFELPEDLKPIEHMERGIDPARENSEFTGMLIINGVSEAEFTGMLIINGVSEAEFRAAWDKWHRGAIMQAFGINALCTPFRNPITGGRE